MIRLAADQVAILLRQLRENGYAVRCDGTTVYVNPRPDQQTAERIRQLKPGLLAALTVPPPMTDTDRGEIAAAFHAFRDRHGPALVAAGWDRQAVFDGLDPLAAACWDELPGVAALLWDGWQLAAIKPDLLEFQREEEVVAKMRDNGFLGGTALEDYRERAAIREYDGGLDRAEAQRQAVSDVVAMAKAGVVAA